MRMPEIYKAKREPEFERKPMPLLTITNEMVIAAVDENGRTLAHITSTFGACFAAEEPLRDAGYDTSWAVWGADGEFVRLAD